MTPLAAILAVPPPAVVAPIVAAPGFEALLATLTETAGEAAPTSGTGDKTTPSDVQDLTTKLDTALPYVDPLAGIGLLAPDAVRETIAPRSGKAIIGVEKPGRSEALDAPDPDVIVAAAVAPLLPIMDATAPALGISPSPPTLSASPELSDDAGELLSPTTLAALPTLASPTSSALLQRGLSTSPALLSEMPPQADAPASPSPTPSSTSPKQVQPLTTSSPRTRGPISGTSVLADDQVDALSSIAVLPLPEQGDSADPSQVSRGQNLLRAELEQSLNAGSAGPRPPAEAAVAARSIAAAPALPADAAQASGVSVSVGAPMTGPKVGAASLATRASRRVGDDLMLTAFAASSMPDALRLVSDPVSRVASIPAAPVTASVDATVRDTSDGFTLATERLGGLHIALDPGEQALRVHVTAERSATAQLITAQTDRLQAAVETVGQRLAALSVDVRDGDGGRRALPWQQPSGSLRRAVAPTAAETRSPDRFA